MKKVNEGGKISLFEYEFNFEPIKPEMPERHSGIDIKACSLGEWYVLGTNLS